MESKMYTFEEAQKEIERIKKSVENNNFCVSVDTLIQWFKEFCYKHTYTEAPYDKFDKERSYTAWSISDSCMRKSKDDYSCKSINSIDDIVNSIIKLEKDKSDGK